MNYNNKLERNLIKYISSNIPLIFLHKFNMEEVEKTIRNIERKNIVEVAFNFNITQGYGISSSSELSDYDELFQGLIEELKLNNAKKNIIVIYGAEQLFNSNGEDLEKLTEILNVFLHKVQTNKYLNTTIVFSGIHYSIPTILRDGAMIIENSLPDENDIEEIITEFIKVNKLETFIEEDQIDSGLIQNLKGLSYYEIKQALSFIFYEFGIKVFNSKIDNDVSKEIYTIKEQMLKKMGTLSIVETNENIDDIIGLQNMKSYIKGEKVSFENASTLTANNIDLPKGILILGEPGTGKSMTAKATANALNLKLIKFDMSKIMGKYVGDSEKNIAETLKVIEHMSPCVLWIDEIEKAFAGVNDGDNQVLRRVFGMLLSWMSDDNKGAFVVGTANNIDGVLPPEFLRKGRFDEIFYVSKPDASSRAELYKSKLRKRNIDVDFRQSSLDALVKASEGFTGSDIDYICNRAAREFHLIKDELKTSNYRLKIKDILLYETGIIKKHKDKDFSIENYSDLKAYYNTAYSEEMVYLKGKYQKDSLEEKVSEIIDKKISEVIYSDIDKILNKKLNKAKYRSADNL